MGSGHSWQHNSLMYGLAFQVRSFQNLPPGWDIFPNLLAHPVANYWISTHKTHTRASGQPLVLRDNAFHIHTEEEKRNVLTENLTDSSVHHTDTTLFLCGMSSSYCVVSVLGRSTTGLVPPCFLCPWNLNWRYFFLLLCVKYRCKWFINSNLFNSQNSTKFRYYPQFIYEQTEAPAG